MQSILKVSKAASIAFTVLLAFLLLLKYFFSLTLIYEVIYSILTGLILIFVLIFICIKILSGRTYGLTAVCIIIAVFLVAAFAVAYFSALRFMFHSSSSMSERIYYKTAASEQKVYFETDGLYYMSDLRYYCLDEADVKLWIFYTNRKTIEGGP